SGSLEANTGAEPIVGVGIEAIGTELGYEGIDESERVYAALDTGMPESSCANSPGVCGLRAGSFCSAWRTAASRSGGTDTLRLRSGSGVWLTWATTTAAGDCPSKGRVAVSIS